MTSFLTLIEESHDSQSLDLLDLASEADALTNLAHVQRIVIALGVGVLVDVSRILPGLQEGRAKKKKR